MDEARERGKEREGERESSLTHVVHMKCSSRC